MSSFSIEDVVYKVSVGTSRRDQAKFELVRLYAADCGCYFHQVSDITDKALDNLANGLFLGSEYSRLYLRTTQVTISELYDLIVDDSFKEFEQNLYFSRAWFHVLSILNPNFKSLKQHPQSSNTCCPIKRKYLSYGIKGELVDTVIKVGLILAAFLTSSWLNGIERYAY